MLITRRATASTALNQPQEITSTSLQHNAEQTSSLPSYGAGLEPVISNPQALMIKIVTKTTYP